MTTAGQALSPSRSLHHTDNRDAVQSVVIQSLCAGDALSLSLSHSKPAPGMSKCHKVAIQVQVSMCAYVRVCVCLLQSTVLITKLLAWGEGDSGGHVL